MKKRVMFSRKSDTKSQALRSEGNKFYSERKFFDALIKYNESLSYAENGSANLGHAFANKSAVYFEMKQFEKCFNNIEMARNNFYPEKQLQTLNNREAKCREMMKSQREKSADVWNFFKLSYPSNPRLPFIANCLEVKRSEKYGRHVITNQDLKVGDIMVVENPFCR
jgi:SET and MYND domain-containing protein 4